MKEFSSLAGLRSDKFECCSNAYHSLTTLVTTTRTAKLYMHFCGAFSQSKFFFFVAIAILIQSTCPSICILIAAVHVVNIVSFISKYLLIACIKDGWVCVHRWVSAPGPYNHPHKQRPQVDGMAKRASV